RVLIVGGIDSQGAQGMQWALEAEIYDPLANTFTNTSDPSLGGNPGGYMALPFAAGSNQGFASPRILHTATLLQDGRVLIAGGYGVEKFDMTDPNNPKPIRDDMTTAFVFDPQTNTFSQTGSLNTARSEHYAVLLASGQVLVVGGFNGALYNNQGGTLPSAEVWDPQTGQFSPLSSTGQDLQIPRQDGAAVSLGGTAIVSQNNHPPQPYLAPQAEILDPQQNKFVAAKGPAQDRYYSTLTESTQGLILAGGFGANGPVMEVEKLDLTSATWSTVAN